MDKSRQVVVMYLISHIGLIFFLYPADIIASLSVGHWSAILFGFVCHVAMLAIFTKGLGCFDALNVIDIFQGVGKIFAFFTLLPVLLYFVMILIIAVRAYSEIVTEIFLGETPLWTIMLLFVAVSTFISLLGIESIFRTGVLVALLFLPLLLFVLVLSFQNADWHYVLPLIDRQAASFSYVIGRPYLQSLFAFVGGFMFLGFVPSHVPFKGRYVVGASFLLLPMFLVSVYVPLLTFGENTASRFPFPFIMAVDTVSISWLMFDRVTMFFMLSLICFLLLFLALVMWNTIQMLKRGLPFIRPAAANILLAALVLVFCLLIPNWQLVERLLWWNTSLRLYAAIVIPCLTLALGMRHRRKGVVQP